jgi:hypothetical protein
MSTRKNSFDLPVHFESLISVENKAIPDLTKGKVQRQAESQQLKEWITTLPETSILNSNESELRIREINDLLLAGLIVDRIKGV